MENDDFINFKIQDPTPTKFIGGYIIGEGLQFNFTKKPFFLHRWFCRILLGWKWTNTP